MSNQNTFLNDQIRKHYLDMPRKQLAEMLGVTESIISVRACRMNLRKHASSDHEKPPEGYNTIKSGFVKVEGNRTIHKIF